MGNAVSDALISSTVEYPLGLALSFASDRIGLLVGFKQDLDSMTRSLHLIKAVFFQAEEWQNQGRAVEEWLKCLEKVAYDADNVLDELHYDSLRHQVESRNGQKQEVCCFSFFSNINLAFRWRMALQVRDIKLKLKGINHDAHELRLASMPVSPTNLPAVPAPRNRQTDSVGVPMYGRDNDKSKIVEMLLSPSEKVVSVLPITGMGGIGKTTLAKWIYNNEQIAGHFIPKIWVCVSKEVEIVELLKLILVQLKGDAVGVNDRENIVKQIGNKLGKQMDTEPKDSRYLLVLDDVWVDDVWDDDVRAVKVAYWFDFFTTLEGLNRTKGSWCLITTRSHELAKTVSRILKMDTKPHVLERLPDPHCWSILKEKAIGEEEEPNELKAIKDRVIKKCDGLPLAASALGGLLCTTERKKWESIVEDRLLRLNGVIEILQLSFDNLPSPAIKKCFAYCSLFPKDTEMERDMLIELWMAEGFLQVDLEKGTLMEKIGEDYLEILLQSSLFEEIRNVWWGTHYKMHDLVHDLAESTSKSTKVINSETNFGGSSNQVRYLAIDSFGEGAVNLLESVSTSLHTLFLRTSLSNDMLMKLKNLYVLNLSGVSNWMLPISIGKLIHLQYIDFSNGGSETLPESICKLYNLQTLRLNNIGIEELPKGMSNLISLRHLHYFNVETFQMPLGIGRLTCLQTLEFFNVGQEKGRQIGELGCLKNLKGSLEIRNLQLVKDKEGAKEANLFEKINLIKLQLEWAQDREGDNCDKDVLVLDGLRPPPNLEELAIKGFMGDQFPQWLMDLPTTLPKLMNLKFIFCNRCREFPLLQNFTSLKDLEIWGCDGLTALPGDMLHSCTSLQKLVILGGDMLTNLPGDMLQSCTSLQDLWVIECDNLISFSLDLQQTPSLLDLVLDKCPKLKTSLTPKGFDFLTGLRKLVIGPFSDDDDDRENSSIYNEFDWPGLISSSSSTLCELELCGLPRMESLPHQLQYLTTLTSLTLSGFGGVEALPDWFGNFVALERLELKDFTKLGHLPSEDAMGRLNKLTSLHVSGSPLLKERCTPQSSGPNSQWSKVSRIQFRSIYGD